jgi:hypothetical protein
MALIKCKECSKEVSSQAKSCPHCGVKLRMGFFSKLILGFFAFFFLMGILGSVIGSNSDSARKTKQEEFDKKYNSSRTPEQIALAEKAQRAFNDLASARYACHEFVIKALHDPGSAEMDSFNQHPAELKKDGTYLVQVTGRAKNGFGALRKVTFNCRTSKVGNTWLPGGVKQIDF